MSYDDERVAASRDRTDHHPRRGGGCLVRALAVVGALAIALVLGALVAWAFFTAGGDTQEASPASAPSPAASPTAATEPPGDLAEGEHWLPGLDAEADRVLSGRLDLHEAHVVAGGTRVGADGTMRFEDLRVDGVVPFAFVESQIGNDARVSPAEDGLVRVALPVPGLGGSATVSVDAEVTPAGRSIEFTPVRLGDGGPLDGLISRIGAIPQEVPDLPQGMNLESIEVTDGGFAVTASGSDVTVTP